MDRPHRRAPRFPRAPLVAVVTALGLVVAVPALPTAHSAFSAATGNPANSLATDWLRPPSDLAAIQACSYAPIAVRGALASTSPSPLSLGVPSETRSGDVLVAQVVYYGTSSITAPSDWTLVRKDTSGSLVTSAVYRKVAAAGEPAATFSRPSTDNGDMVGGIVAYSGVSRSAPVSVEGVATGSGEKATSPGLTTTATGVVVLHLLAKGSAQFPTPAGTTGRWRLSSDSEGVTAADEPFAGPGAIPRRTSTVSGSTTPWIAQAVVLRPALEQAGASLTWTASPSSWADGYRLERSAGGTVQATRSLTSVGTTATTEGPLPNGVSYTFRLWAHRGTWESSAVSTTIALSC
ncbi:hypothetical protein SAMN06893096_107124 [Geodermatophilus pulveris]|uniref:Fibronectin type-III domain-containing protein n=1 Tax=Geodermatophilus pulveris TaxID=1564159 RepID=A0A239GYR2_9ACTN|nr:hypothetical protein [Geodermatophilus pulveris]SNS74270.1 hypothetical protein SAMN06893096_107124 [Geodermatophilus pulveris]